LTDVDNQIISWNKSAQYQTRKIVTYFDTRQDVRVNAKITTAF